MNFSRITTVTFDIGNTLVLVDYAQIAEAAAHMGISLTVEQLQRAEHAGKIVVDKQVEADEKNSDDSRWADYFRAILEATGIPPGSRSDLLDEVLRRDIIGLGIWSKINPDTSTALSELKRRGYKLGVISNADGRIKELVKSLGIEKYFSAIIDSHDVGVEKPDPAIFNLALNTLDCLAENAVYIGDIYSIDVLGAQSAGITPFLIDPFDQYRVDYCVKLQRLGDILKLLPGKSIYNSEKDS